MGRQLLLAIAPACITSVNRAIYRLLATKYHVNVHLVLPKHYRVGPKLKACESITDEPFMISLLEPSGPQNRLYRLRGLRKLIRRVQPSHVLIDTGPASLLTWEVVRELKGSATKVWAITYENQERNYLQEGFEGLRRGQLVIAAGGFISEWLRRSLRHKVHCIFTLSQDSMRVMSNLEFTGTITQIPLGFDPQLFYPQSKDRIAATRNSLGLCATTIAYFGRLVPEKGIHHLVQALYRLRDLSWLFLIDRFSLYDSPYAKHLHQLIEKLDLASRVVYFDATHTEMPDYMNAADIVVLPSITTPKFKEQYGRVIPEAMACGKIVVGSRSGTIPELIADSGFLFPEGNIDSLAELLRRLLTAPAEELAAIQAKAKRRAHTYLSILRQADIWAEMLNVRRGAAETLL